MTTRPRSNDPIEPMTLENITANGLRCSACSAISAVRVIVNVDHLSRDLTVHSFGPKMVCTKCRTIGADMRPNWKERVRA